MAHGDLVKSLVVDISYPKVTPAILTILKFKIIIRIRNFDVTQCPQVRISVFFIGEGGSGCVQLGPPVQLGSNDMPVERFLAMLRFEHKSKLGQLGIKIGSLDPKKGK